MALLRCVTSPGFIYCFGVTARLSVSHNSCGHILKPTKVICYTLVNATTNRNAFTKIPNNTDDKASTLQGFELRREFKKEDVNSILKQITDIIGKKSDGLWDDQSFQMLMNRLNEETPKLTSVQLLDSITLLMPTCPDHDPFIMSSLENQVRWMMRRMTVSQLIRLLQLHISPSTDLRRTMRDELLAMLERRWVEISSGRDVVTLLHLIPGSSGHIIERLEDRALELCETMTVKELYRTLYMLARKHRRTVPLLRALVHHMGHRTLDLNAVHLCNLTYALATLNIYDGVLMDKIIITATGLPAIISDPKVSVQTFSSLVQSFGILRWNDKRILDVAFECYQRHPEAVTAVEWQHFLLTAAWINYLPPKLGTAGLSRVCADMITLASHNPVAWLDVVWSGTVLSALTPQLATSVLDQSFVSNVEKAAGTNTFVAYTKLLNINAMAQHTLSEYEGPLLPTSFIEMACSQIQPKHHSKLFESVFEALSEIAPAEQYLKTDVITNMGHTVDIEMLLNDAGSPQPISALSSALPDGVHRMAVQLLNFSDMTSGNIQPNGPCSLAAKALTLAGFKVLQVAYSDFDIAAPVVKRVQNLHRKLKNLLPATADNDGRPVDTVGMQTVSPDVTPVDRGQGHTPSSKCAWLPEQTPAAVQKTLFTSQSAVRQKLQPSSAKSSGVHPKSELNPKSSNSTNNKQTPSANASDMGASQSKNVYAGPPRMDTLFDKKQKPISSQFTEPEVRKDSSDKENEK